ncbi:uncharacterized protein ALTATR162_LOCUS3116 [Alternaria atra]|uniref:Uncharacterized protein n=1 Tax=Alternaria atra TaxID=119953 RepID=A0A8J2HY00_9PLEO|nr:uncharacterized protein ALTATR162_LOCUS3116 [Alternaria atra]CAG5153292.1 unnamed protein product [Alternaria atra]
MPLRILLKSILHNTLERRLQYPMAYNLEISPNNHLSSSLLYLPLRPSWPSLLVSYTLFVVDTGGKKMRSINNEISNKVYSELEDQYSP